jgi:uncharacterized protein YbjT (DUF2867 family)
MRILVTGATGFIGGRLARRLLAEGHHVRALVRDPAKAEHLERAGAELQPGDLLDPASLRGAGEGIDVAYYLVHSMGRGAGGDFAPRDRAGAENFASVAAAAGVRRIVYLGGLGQGSELLDSRHATAGVLRASGVPVTYFRAAAVIGADSESFRTVLHLVRRLPVMVTPRWVSTRTQPIAIDDVLDYLVAAADLRAPLEREIEIGGPDVTTYGGVIDETARAMGRRPPLRVSVPVLTPWLSSLWIGLVTPVDAGVARPLIEGLAIETVVSDPSGMSLFEVEPMPLAAALRSALAESGPRSD